MSSTANHGPQNIENSRPCGVVRRDYSARYDREIQGEIKSDCVAPRTPEIEDILANETEIDFFTEKQADSRMDHSSGLFKDLDLLDILKDTGVYNSDDLDKIEGLDAIPEILGPLETSPEKPCATIFNSTNNSSMDNLFFEEFMDLAKDKLFPDLDELNLGMGEEFCALMLPDVCFPDITPVTGTDNSGTQMASHPDNLSCPNGLASEEPSEEPVVLQEEVTVIETSDGSVSPTPSSVSNALCEVAPVALEISSEGAVDGNKSTITDFDELFAQLLSPSDATAGVSVGDSSSEFSFEALSPSSSISDDIDVVGSPSTKRSLEECDDEPVTKRAKVVMNGTDKATQRRIKNNIASRYSRASRRMKEKDLFEQEKNLKKDNEELKRELESLTKLTQSLRQLLVQKLSTN